MCVLHSTPLCYAACALTSVVVALCSVAFVWVLRSLCTSFLIQHSDEVELLSLLHIATLYSLPRLEHHCLSVRLASASS